MKRLGCLASVLLLAAAGCESVPRVDEVPTATLLFAGDLMLGRDVEPVATLDPVGLFEDVRFVVREADVAAANLESPLTTRPHLDPTVHALEADPGLAALVGAAGFDVLGIANNHAGDAGPDAVLDTVAAIAKSGLIAVGGGADAADALRPVVVERNGLRIAYLAFDATGRGAAAGSPPGMVPGQSGRCARLAGWPMW